MATDTLASPATLSHTPTKVLKNFIDGEWVDSSTGETFEDRNPADTRDVVGIFQKSAKADVDAAVDAAKRAFAKWRLVPAPRRAEVVFRTAEILIERKEDYAREMTRETVSYTHLDVYKRQAERSVHRTAVHVRSHHLRRQESSRGRSLRTRRSAPGLHLSLIHI